MGLSQKQLASRLGVARATVWRWETQGIHPELDMLAKLAELFGVAAIELDPSLAALLQSPAAPAP